MNFIVRSINSGIIYWTVLWKMIRDNKGGYILLLKGFFMLRAVSISPEEAAEKWRTLIN